MNAWRLIVGIILYIALEEPQEHRTLATPARAPDNHCVLQVFTL